VRKTCTCAIGGTSRLSRRRAANQVDLLKHTRTLAAASRCKLVATISANPVIFTASDNSKQSDDARRDTHAQIIQTPSVDPGVERTALRALCSKQSESSSSCDTHKFYPAAQYSLCDRAVTGGCDRLQRDPDTESRADASLRFRRLSVGHPLTRAQFEDFRFSHPNSVCGVLYTCGHFCRICWKRDNSTGENKLSADQLRQLAAIRGKLPEAEFPKLSADNRENIELFRAELAKPDHQRFEPEPDAIVGAVREQLGLGLSVQRRSMPILIGEQVKSLK